MENTDLVIKDNNQLELRSFEQVWKLSKLLIQSGMFGTENKAEVATKIVTGLEMGISPVRAVRHIDTIEGKPSVSAQLSAAMLRMHPRYDYRIEGVSMDGAKVVITYDDEDVGSASFTYEEAQQAGIANKSNWKNYRRDMLFARAIKRGKKWHAPDVGIGREYMPDELGRSDSPTVEVPNEVVKEAQSEDTKKSVDAEYEEVDTEEGKEERKPQGETKEDHNPNGGVGKDTSDSGDGMNEDRGSSSDLDMQVESESEDEYDPNEDNSLKGDGSKEQNTSKPKTLSNERHEPYAIPGGIDEVDGGKLDEIEYELRQKSDDRDILKNALNRYRDYWRECKEGEFRTQLNELLNHFEEHHLEYDNEVNDPTLEDLKSPTQTIIEEMDENLSELEGDDLYEQVGNYRSEVSKYSDPAKTVALDVLQHHEDRLNEKARDEVIKEYQAEWQSNLSTSQTLLGQKLKNTHNWKPLRDLLSKLDEKARTYIRDMKDDIGEKGLAKSMIKQWNMASGPYYVIIDIRKAVLEGNSPDYDEFNYLLDDTTEELKAWDDKKKAAKAHDIISNEVMRLDEEVEGFDVQVED